MNQARHFSLLLITAVLTYLTAFYAGSFYCRIIPCEGGWIGGDAIDYIIGLPLSFVLFLTFLFTAFGGTKKYWWIGILLIPAFVFELYFDLTHIYFPILLGLGGWVLGFLVSKTSRSLLRSDLRGLKKI